MSPEQAFFGRLVICPRKLCQSSLKFSRNKLKATEQAMKKSRFSEEQLIGILKHGEAGVKTTELIGTAVKAAK
jgi:hypothetical protein